MAPRTRRRRRGQGDSANGLASSLLSQVTDLVAENKQLTEENRELRAIVDRVSQAVKGVSSRRQSTGGGTSAGSGEPVRKRRTRRKITDPATLERRRAALAKARKVLADRRAASKAS